MKRNVLASCYSCFFDCAGLFSWSISSLASHNWGSLPKWTSHSKKENSRHYSNRHNNPDNDDDSSASDIEDGAAQQLLEDTSLLLMAADRASPLFCARSITDPASETPLSSRSRSPVIPVSRLLGKILVGIQYFSGQKKLEVTVREGHGLQLIDRLSASQVALTLQPDGRKRLKTWFVEGQNPKFDQIFTFDNISQEDLCKKWVELRVYRKREGRKRKQLLAETSLKLSLIDAKHQTCTNHLLNLSNETADQPNETLHLPTGQEDQNVSRRSSMLDAASGSYCTGPGPDRTDPQLLLSLCYDDQMGQLVVGLEKAVNLAVHSTNPDTLVKVTALSPYGDEIGKHKTDVARGRRDPVFNAAYVYQIGCSEMRYTSILVQVYSYLGVWRRRLLIGWLSLGQNCSSESARDHWDQMIQGMGTSVSKWHVLIEP